MFGNILRTDPEGFPIFLRENQEVGILKRPA
jgi:hypothetical protein